MTEPTSPSGPAKPQATLSRDLADFLIELSIALHKHAMYPGGHPSLAPATERVVERLTRVLEGRSTLSLGVARQQLVIEGVATDPKNPVLKDLASRLHRHHLGAITFRQGLAPRELHNVLTLLEADRTGEPLGLGPRERLSAWAHVRLYPLTYERLDLLEEAPPPADRDDSTSREDRTRAAQLWLGLARAALAADTVAGEAPADQPPPTDPTAVARAIQAHPRGTAYDQVIVGYLLQIADRVKAGVSPEDQALRHRVSQLITDLDGDTLKRLLEMGGDRGQRRQFVLNASDGLAVDAVIDLFRAAGQAENDTVSHSMLRMLGKLAQHARGVSPARRMLADQSVREQVAELVRGWSLDDPNPDAYRAGLQRIAWSDPRGARSDVRHAAEPERILQMALELRITGPAVDRAVLSLVEQGELAKVVRALSGSEDEQSAAAIWQQLATDEVIRRTVTTEPLDVALLDLLLPRAGMAAAEPLLDALVASNSSQTRRALLDRVTQLGRGVGPLAVERLRDASWFVQRNMLGILRGLPERPAGFDARPFAEHPDARVRREALRILFTEPAARDRAICRALTDADQRTVRLGLNAALDGCPDLAVPLAASLATRGASQDHRVAAIRALGAAPGRAGVDALLTLVRPKKWLFWRKKPAPTPEYRAALAALQGNADDPKVRAVLDQLGEP
ncbi:MAG: hypothetical protein HYV20_13725 [Gemmatimonadetes bacterium]|nr:hypothetical protein [Gemmatimonadota bacterium]